MSSNYYSGTKQMKKGEYHLAIQNFTKAIELFPRYTDAYLERGLCYVYLEDYDHALEDFLMAIDIDPDDKLALNRLGYFYDREKVRNLEKAFYYYNMAILKQPDYYPPYYNRALCYIRTARYDDALQDCSKAIALDPKNAWNFITRGKTFALKGDYSHAVADFENAVKLGNTEYVPKDAVSIVHHANQDKIKEVSSLYFKRGDYVDVAGNFQEYLIFYQRISTYRIVLKFYDFGPDTDARSDNYKFGFGAEKVSKEEWCKLFYSANHKALGENNGSCK
jgi:Flp pilus assembly protein TadD